MSTGSASTGSTSTGSAVRLPVLTGPRVRLVPVPSPLARDLLAGRDALAALDDLHLRPAPGWPHAETADALQPVAAQPDGDGPVPVFLVVDGDEVVGTAGLAGPPDDQGDQELAYGLAPARRRQGLGTEAVALLAAWAERQPGVRRLLGRVRPGNEASWRLLGRLGFERQGRDPHDPGHELWVRGRGPGSAVRVAGRHVC